MHTGASTVSHCLVSVQALQRVQRSTKQDMQLARKQLHLAKAQLAEVRRTAHPNPESAPGFCADINRNLMAPVPSKPVEVSSRQTWNDSPDAALGALIKVGDAAAISWPKAVHLLNPDSPWSPAMLQQKPPVQWLCLV